MQYLFSALETCRLNSSFEFAESQFPASNMKQCSESRIDHCAGKHRPPDWTFHHESEVCLLLLLNERSACTGMGFSGTTSAVYSTTPRVHVHNPISRTASPPPSVRSKFLTLHAMRIRSHVATKIFQNYRICRAQRR